MAEKAPRSAKLFREMQGFVYARRLGQPGFLPESGGAVEQSMGSYRNSTDSSGFVVNGR
jgi:hypothetical protein